MGASFTSDPGSCNSCGLVAAGGKVPDPASTDHAVQAETIKVAHSVLSRKSSPRERAPMKRPVATLRGASRAFWTAWLAARTTQTPVGLSAGISLPDVGTPADGRDSVATAPVWAPPPGDADHAMPSSTTLALWTAQLT